MASVSEEGDSVSIDGDGGGGESLTIQSFSFSPATLKIKTGTTVVWTNQDGAPHTVTSTDDPKTDATTMGLFDSGSPSQGQQFTVTFDAAGTYYYECTIHAAMASTHAQVMVQ